MEFKITNLFDEAESVRGFGLWVDALVRDDFGNLGEQLVNAFLSFLAAHLPRLSNRNVQYT
jgi:hypothetical protein